MVLHYPVGSGAIRDIISFVNCGHCGHSFTRPPGGEGRNIVCPSCKGITQAPLDTAILPPAPTNTPEPPPPPPRTPFYFWPLLAAGNALALGFFYFGAGLGLLDQLQMDRTFPKVLALSVSALGASLFLCAAFYIHQNRIIRKYFLWILGSVCVLTGLLLYLSAFQWPIFLLLATGSISLLILIFSDPSEAYSHDPGASRLIAYLVAGTTLLLWICLAMFLGSKT